MATSPLLLAAGGAAAGVAVGGPVGAAIGAAAGLLLGLATGGESESTLPMTAGRSGSTSAGAGSIVEILDAEGDRYNLPWRAIDWNYAGTVNIRPADSSSGWRRWAEKYSSGNDSSSKTLRAYRLATGCSPSSDRYAAWSRFAIDFDDARAYLLGIEPTRRNEALQTLIGIGVRGSDLSDLSEAENFWASQFKDLANYLYFVGAQRIPVTLASFEKPLTKGLLTAIIKAANESASDCDLLPGRGMGCTGEFEEVDTKDYLCKGTPGSACTIDSKAGKYNQLGLCVQEAAPPTEAELHPNATLVQRTVYYDKFGNVVADPKLSDHSAVTSVWECNPGYLYDESGTTCVSVAKTCPSGQFLNPLGQCVSPEPVTSYNDQGQIQITGPTVSQTSVADVEKAIGGGISPVVPTSIGGGGSTASGSSSSKSSDLSKLVGTITGGNTLEKKVDTFTLASFSAPPRSGLTRFANMGIGLPRRRG